jgi:hypothetical protein
MCIFQKTEASILEDDNKSQTSSESYTLELEALKKTLKKKGRQLS